MKWGSCLEMSICWIWDVLAAVGGNRQAKHISNPAFGANLEKGGRWYNLSFTSSKQCSWLAMYLVNQNHECGEPSLFYTRFETCLYWIRDVRILGSRRAYTGFETCLYWVRDVLSGAGLTTHLKPNQDLLVRFKKKKNLIGFSRGEMFSRAVYLWRRDL